MVRLEKSPDDRPTGNAYWLASEGIHTLLATEIENGETAASREDPPVDCEDGERESDLGSRAGGGGTFLKTGHSRVARTVRAYWPSKCDPTRGKRTGSQHWRTFVRDQARAIVACDFLVSITASFRALSVLVVMELGSRRILHCNVTAHPTAEWTVQQFREAIPSEHAYRFLIRDRDSIFSEQVDRDLKGFGLKILRTPIRAPKAMVTKHGIDRRNFLQQAVVLGTSLSLPQMELDSSQGEYDISLGTWPHRIYKENDGHLEPATTESFVFNLLVKENQNRPLTPLSARLEFYAAEDKVHVLELSRKALDAIRAVSIATRGPDDKEDEVFDFRHYFSLPISLSADRLVYDLVLIQAGGREVRQKLEIPLLRYEQKTKLIFPI